MPTAGQPLSIPCPGCEGRGCDECRNGEIEIADCPLKMITGEIWQIITLSELFEKGLPPVTGGALEQAKIFVESARFVFSEKEYWKNKLGLLF